MHILRHGEVFNPSKVLYGRMPGLPPLRAGREDGRRWPPRRSPAGTSRTSSPVPLERAQQTAEPFAAQFQLPVAVDERLIESANFFEGQKFGVGDGALRDPRNWWQLRNPVKPSWGEPYKADRPADVRRAEAARAAADGHEAVCVSHQLPIWTLRRFVERARLLARPAQAAVRAWPA